MAVRCCASDHALAATLLGEGMVNHSDAYPGGALFDSWSSKLAAWVTPSPVGSEGGDAGLLVSLLGLVLLLVRRGCAVLGPRQSSRSVMIKPARPLHNQSARRNKSDTIRLSRCAQLAALLSSFTAAGPIPPPPKPPPPSAPSPLAPSPQSTPSTSASMLAFQAFHLATYHFAQGTFQPTAASSARGCSELDSLLGGGPGLVDLNAALDVCFDGQFSCSYAEVQQLRRRRLSPAKPWP